MLNSPIPRLDQAPELREYLTRYCRLKRGEIWDDPKGVHRVGCINAESGSELKQLMLGHRAQLAIHDPPYNFIAFQIEETSSFIEGCRRWIENTNENLGNDSSLYVWLGADQRDHYRPLPDFILMMREMSFKSRSWITVRNQRGFGTQKNWMSVRQELLYYTKGQPYFDVEAEYTDIPKILRGYYKEVNGAVTENTERGKAPTIRAGNVWVDIQQVFYRLEENVSGCYAQKPLESYKRIIRASSGAEGLVLDFFSHSGACLLACEMLKRRCFTTDIDPVYSEISIRRLERFRKLGKLGWQNSNPFEEELRHDDVLRSMLCHDSPVDTEPQSLTLF